MDINQILEQLRAEREQIEAAILALERLVRGGGKRRGRPPKWLQPDGVGGAPEGEPKKPRKFTEEARRRMSEAQRKRWAAKHVQPS
jgi:hypothetical protein